MRHAVRLMIAARASAVLLMGAACDGLRLPAPPARANSLSAGDHAGATAAKPNRAPKPAPPRSIPPSTPDASAQIRRGLRRLVVAEETYYAENGVYTEDCRPLGFTPERRHRDPVPLAVAHRLGGERHPSGHAGTRLRHLRGPGARRADDAPGRAVRQGRGAGLRRRLARRASPRRGRRRPTPAAGRRPGRVGRRTPRSALDAVNPIGPDAGGPPQPGALAGHLLRGSRASTPAAPSRSRCSTSGTAG